jgi:hypothetical protein
MENVSIFYDYLEHFTAIWPFGIVCGHLVYFSILVCLPKKNLATLVFSFGTF